MYIFHRLYHVIKHQKTIDCFQDFIELLNLFNNSNNNSHEGVELIVARTHSISCSTIGKAVISNTILLQQTPGVFMLINTNKKSALMLVEKALNLDREVALSIPFLSFHLWNENILILHAGSIRCLKDNSAALFLGNSGAGKTTICNQAYDSGYSVLSDELVYVTCKNNSVFAQSAQIYSDGHTFMPYLLPEKVNGIFLLIKSTKTAVSSLSFYEKLNTVSSSMIRVFSTGTESKQVLMLLELLSIKQLEFPKDNIEWEMLFHEF